MLLSPVWQEWRDGCFHLVVSHGDIKATHVRARPQAGIVVAEDGTPYRGVEAHGTAELLEGGIRSGRADGGEVSRRRVPAELDREGHVLRLRPERLRAWSFSDWYGG